MANADGASDPSCCVICKQKYGAREKDEPAGSVAGFVVSPSRPGQSGGSCLHCHYVHRGSFKSLNLPDLVSKLDEHQQLADKFAQLRASHIQALSRNPKGKPRHERVNIEMFTRKRESDYVDVKKEMVWHSIDSYFQEHATDDAKKRCRNTAQKRKYIAEVLGMPLQYDDAGVEGVAVDLRPEGQKLIVVGKRFSVEKEKCQRHEDKDEQGQAFEKLASRLTKVDGIDQATEKKKLNEAKEESGSSSSSSSDDSDSDSSSGVGLKKATKSKAKGKARPKGASRKPNNSKDEKVDVKQEGAEPSIETEASTPAGSAGGQSAWVQFMDKCGTLQSLFESLGTWELWTRSIKEKDLEQKLTKALELVSKGEGAPDRLAQKAAAQLLEQVNRITEAETLLGSLAKADPACMQTSVDAILRLCQGFGMEQLTGFLSDIAKQLLSILLSSEGADARFWYWLSVIKDEKCPGFGFNALKEQEDRLDQWKVTKDELHQVLCQVQVGALNNFVDRLRTASTTVSLHSIPESWFLPALCRTPIGSGVELTLTATGGIENRSGICTKALQDMQRFICCGKVSTTQRFANDIKQGFQEVVACSAVSARVNLVFRSNIALKTLWLQVIEVAKTTLDESSALFKSKQMCEKMAALEVALSESTMPTPDPEKWKELGQVNDMLDLISKTDGKNGMTEEQKFAYAELSKAKVSMVGKAPSFPDTVTELDGFLQKQWVTAAQGCELVEVSDETMKSIKKAVYSGLIDLNLGRVRPHRLSNLIISLGLSLLKVHGEPVGGNALLLAWQELHDDVKQAHAELKDTEAHKIVVTVHSFFQRLEQQVNKWVHEMLVAVIAKDGMAQGLEACATALKLPAKIPDQSMDWFHTIRSLLKVQDDVLGGSTLKPEHSELHKHLPPYIKFKGLDTKFLKGVAGDKAEQIEKFCSRFETDLKEWFRKSQDTLGALHKELDPVRPLIKAADDMTDASLAPVKWTFALTEEVGIKLKEVFEHLLKGRDEAATWLPFLKALQGCASAMPQDDRWGRTTFEHFLTDVEDFRKAVAQCVAFHSVADVVVNPGEYKEDFKGSEAKIFQYIASLGVSRQDLPTTLLKLFQNVMATGSSAEPEKSKEKKRKPTKKEKEPQEKAPKKSRVSNEGKKRKKN